MSLLPESPVMLGDYFLAPDGYPTGGFGLNDANARRHIWLCIFLPRTECNHSFQVALGNHDLVRHSVDLE